METLWCVLNGRDIPL